MLIYAIDYLDYVVHKVQRWQDEPLGRHGVLYDFDTWLAPRRA
jgi:hypothetical protein